MRTPKPLIVRRVLRAGAALSLVGALTLTAGLPVAGQEADPGGGLLPEAFLDGYGWFNKAQQSPTGGNVPTPPSCPSSPASQCSVGPPADGLYVAYDAEAVVPGTVTGPISNVPTLPGITQPPAPAPTVSGPPQPLGPTALGAVRYAVPEGTDAQLTLKILSRSTTTPGGADPTVGKLFACIVVQPGWLAAQNARYDQGPKYDCTTADQGDIQGDAVTFDLGPQFVQNMMIDVAIVPMGSDPVNGGDRPFQMALAAPTDASLAILNAADLAEATAEPFSEDFESFDDPSAGFGDESFTTTEDFTETFTEDVSFGETFAGNDSFGAVSSAPVARPRVGRPQIAVPAGNIIANPFRKDASRGERTLAVLLLLAIAGGLWWVGGQQVRAPRLLGSLGAGTPNVFIPDVRDRGIGRFARVRATERPPRLF